MISYDDKFKDIFKDVIPIVLANSTRTLEGRMFQDISKCSIMFHKITKGSIIFCHVSNVLEFPEG